MVHALSMRRGSPPDDQETNEAAQASLEASQSNLAHVPPCARVNIAPLIRFRDNPILRPDDIRFMRVAGAFNPGAAVCHRTGKVAILVRLWDTARRRSLLGMAISSDGEHVDEVWDRPALAPEAPYEEWGVEDCRVTFLADEGRYAITYTGYSRRGPRVCLITTDNLLDPTRYRRHGPRIDADDKNAVIFPERIGGRYVVLHRPMPQMVLAEVDRLEDPWPIGGTPILGPIPGTWRSSPCGCGRAAAPHQRWLATAVPRRNHSRGGKRLLDGLVSARHRRSHARALCVVRACAGARSTLRNPAARTTAGRHAELPDRD